MSEKQRTTQLSYNFPIYFPIFSWISLLDLWRPTPEPNSGNQLELAGNQFWKPTWDCGNQLGSAETNPNHKKIIGKS